jgi:tetratricopeptide (TPR) repeat protein
MTFFELEKECKKRKRRFILFFLLILLFVCLIIVFGIKFFIKEKKLSHKTDKVKIENHPVKKINHISIQNDKKDKQMVLKPIIDLNISYINKASKKSVKKETKINKTDKIFNISTLPSFETCIKLADEYFKNKDFENALKWAKNANIQNKKDPRSWIIVSLSLYKLGKKDKALQILQVYYDYTKNKDILKLIERMKHDKI